MDVYVIFDVLEGSQPVSDELTPFQKVENRLEPSDIHPQKLNSPAESEIQSAFPQKIGVIHRIPYRRGES